jgi:hypothetical protein
LLSGECGAIHGEVSDGKRLSGLVLVNLRTVRRAFQSMRKCGKR